VGTEADTLKIAAALEEVIPRSDLTFSLDLLLESIETAQKERENARELDLNPPKIIIMNRPAVLVRIDGEPILEKVEGTSLKRVVNTPYFIVQYASTGKYFLHGGDLWFSAKKIAGPWSRTTATPKSIIYLYNQVKSDEEFYEDSTATDVMMKTGKVPEIVVSTEPAELIATDGPMKLVPIQGTGLLYVSNTPSRLFLEIKTQQRFILVSGRWYTAESINGPWEFIASDKLPEDFKNIPPGSECDDVLASVAGTIPAKEAVFDAQIPQMAEVDRAETTSEVEYDGNPQFESIENTGMDYAVNTSTAVIRFNGRYYDCDRGIWFVGETPYGPWMVCTYVPEIIYTIPPSYPVYNVRYVRVYHYTPDVVYVGYTAGYTGCYVYGRAVVYGTGYNYHSWYKRRYYARPWTWGFNVHYDPWTGWSFGARWGHSRGWFARHPKNVYAGWWGPGEYHPVYRPAKKPVYREGYHPVYRERESKAPVVKTANVTIRTSGVRRSATLYDNRSTSVRRPAAIETTRSSRGGTRTTAGETRQPETRPISRPVNTPVTQPQPVSKPETQRDPRRPETPAVSRPVPTPVTPPQAQPVPKPEIPREPRQPETPAVSRPVPTPVTQPVSQPVSRPVRPPVVTRPSTQENNVYAAPDGNVMRTTPQGMQQRDRNTWKQADDTPAKQETVRDSEVRQRTAERTASPGAPTISPTPARTASPTAAPAPVPGQQKRDSDDKNKGRKR
jgi:hypothetical protein